MVEHRQRVGLLGVLDVGRLGAPEPAGVEPDREVVAGNAGDLGVPHPQVRDSGMNKEHRRSRR